MSPPLSAFAWLIAARSEPAPLSLVLLTRSVESSARPSSAITIGRSRRLLLAFVASRRHPSGLTSMRSHDMFSCSSDGPPRRRPPREDDVARGRRAVVISHATAAIGPTAALGQPSGVVVTLIDPKLAAPFVALG